MNSEELAPVVTRGEDGRGQYTLRKQSRFLPEEELWVNDDAEGWFSTQVQLPLMKLLAQPHRRENTSKPGVQKDREILVFKQLKCRLLIWHKSYLTREIEVAGLSCTSPRTLEG